MENKKRLSAWIWIVIILIVLGVGTYFLLNGGSGIPSPPALPS